MYGFTAAQEYVLENIASKTLNADQFYGVDDYGATYYSREAVFYKVSARGDYQFTALQLGPITSVDILNPLKITVFYEQTNTAVILDNTLTEITRINFSTINDFRNISHVTTNGDRRLWIFNTDLQQLEIFDWNTGQITTQFPPMPVNALLLATNFNFAWVAYDKGLFYYNNYGSFLNSTSLLNITHLAQSNGAVILLSQGILYYKPRDLKIFTLLEGLDFTIKQLSLSGEILYLYHGQQLSTFKLKIPK